MPSVALLFQSVLLGLLLGGLYALLASGLTLYFGIMRVVTAGARRNRPPSIVSPWPGGST